MIVTRISLYLDEGKAMILYTTIAHCCSLRKTIFAWVGGRLQLVVTLFASVATLLQSERWSWIPPNGNFRSSPIQGETHWIVSFYDEPSCSGLLQASASYRFLCSLFRPPQVFWRTFTRGLSCSFSSRPLSFSKNLQLSARKFFTKNILQLI